MGSRLKRKLYSVAEKVEGRVVTWLTIGTARQQEDDSLVVHLDIIPKNTTLRLKELVP